MQLPETFIIRTKELLGDEWAVFEQALNEESPVSIRLNPRKITPDALSEILPLSEPVVHATGGYYLSNRPSFTFDPWFHAGCYYVQEASSMILEQVVRTYFPQPASVLDLCAAPGGKSTHLSTLLPDESLLIANEVIRSRANILIENLVKWGNPNTLVTQNDPLEIGKSLPGFFDGIVADLPCSGEGMFRKDPAVIAEWSVNNVKLCAERQRRIVADVWPALKPDGILVYSTCTYNREENEENIEWICRELDAELLEDPRRLMPHKTRGEGFFMGVLRKRGHQTQDRRHKTQDRKGDTLHASPFAFCLASPENFIFISENSGSHHSSLVTSSWIAIPAIHHSAYVQVKNRLRMLSAGITLGETKGQDRIPAHGLAMSNALSGAAFPQWEVDKETAWNYLRKEALQTIPPELPKGYLLITYKEHPMGFVKNIGTRANNLYPQEWRIRK